MALAIIIYISVAVAVFIKTTKDGWQGAAPYVIGAFWPIMVPAISAFILLLVYAFKRGPR